MFGESSDTSNEPHYKRTRLALAKIVLDSFLMVGITEQMDRSVSVENVSKEGRDDLSWLTPGDSVGSLLLQSVVEDHLLYQHALACLAQSEDMVRQGHHMHGNRIDRKSFGTEVS